MLSLSHILWLSGLIACHSLQSKSVLKKKYESYAVEQ